MLRLPISKTETIMRATHSQLPSVAKTKAIQQAHVETIACLAGVALVAAGWYALKLFLQI